jgi:chemotaxis protein MotB
VRPRKHAAHEEEHENSERWLLTYADMITLLLALFMMLYAMSQLDIAKYQKFQEAFTKGMGGHPVEEAKEIAPDDATSTVAAQAAGSATVLPSLDQEQLKALKKKLEKALTTAGLQDQVQLELQPRGLVMNVVSGVLFPSGSASLTKGGDALLHNVGKVFTTFGNKMVVEGHTDPRPISSAKFPSNWELSTARATSVLRFLLEDHHLKPTRVSAAGYADTRPRVPNTGEEQMAHNRRVDIVILAAPSKVVAASAKTAKPAESSHGTSETGHGEQEEKKEESSGH